MLIDKVKVGDTVYVSDWSYAVNADNVRSMYLGYNPWGKEPHVVIAKGKFPGESVSGRIVFNNIHLKNVSSGDEFYIKARFIRKLKKERICQGQKK